MNPQSFSDFNQETSQPQNLSETVEELEIKLQRLQALAQTLISGLIVAILISIGVSGWFAYRLNVQQQTAQRKAEEFEQTEQELQEQLNSLEQQFTKQQQKIERLNEQLPQELETLSRAVNSNQRQLNVLQQQLNSSNNSQKKNSGDKSQNKSKQSN
ncbi:MAG: hypothetical protein ABEI32_14230 [Halothece sp.]